MSGVMDKVASILEESMGSPDAGERVSKAALLLHHRCSALMRENDAMKTALERIRQLADERQDGAPDASLGDKACGRIYGVANDVLKYGPKGGAE